LLLLLLSVYEADGLNGVLPLLSYRYNPYKGETVPCAWDYSPQDGSECKGGADQIWVCGSCGMLWDASYPSGVRRA
jgi:hypothetical protein